MEIPNTSSQQSINFISNNEQYLFLLEFFIHYLSGDRLKKINQTCLVPTSVSLQFLNLEENDAIKITPVDLMFTPRVKDSTSDVENFYAGQSVLFAMPYQLVIDKNLEFNIKLKAFKEMAKTDSEILIGNGELNFTTQFSNLRNEISRCWQKGSSVSKDYEGPINFYYQEELAATSFIFVRVSAFGQSIITEMETFDIDDDKKSFIFKDDESLDKPFIYKLRIISESLLSVNNKLNKFNIKNKMKSGAMYYCSPCRYPGANIIDLMNDTCQVFKDDLVLKNISKHNQPIQSSRGKFNQLCGKPVVLKVSGDLDEAGNINKPKDVISSVDTEHDIFVLRVGKKGIVGDGEKCDFQIEMKTPKGPDRRPPIKYETREMQTEVDEPDEKLKAKGGKKKQKGKAKKKKKKKKK
ncbi:uncharacterized protein [Chelonus insularis]|uniref:uncharacterized protein n=1 Tax=Chelonus insularis TaxID=460826 RepID=UPI0015891714|nr:uncharacterized protein LOC118071876 [Chelonus insularis]